MASYPLTENHKLLKKGFEHYLQTPFTTWDKFAHQFYYREMAPQEHWIKAGEYCTELCFILKGLLRVYYIDDAGNEVNQNFYQANESISSVIGIINNEPCQYYMQALEPTQVMMADFKSLHVQGLENPEWLRLELNMLQSVFIKMARREARLLLDNAEQRYKWFCKYYPELLARLPQYHIASFLGITPVSLSRLRKNLD